jgi:uncharacterized damage-inducible protein DinB
VTDLAEARFLLAFTRWASAQILTAAEQLPADAFTRDLRSSFPSVRDTLVHMLWSDAVWLERCRGRSPRDLLEPTAFPTVPALRARWSPVETGFLALVSDQATDLTRLVTYINRKGEQWTYPLGSIIRHVANHATHHRGQLVTMLRQLGRVPPTTELLVFVDVGAPGAEPGALGV